MSDVKTHQPVYDDSGKYDISTKSGFMKALFRNVLKVRFSKRVLITTAICGAIVLSGRILNPVRVVGVSMEPTYKNGQLLFTSTSVKPEKIKYDSIVIYDVPQPQGLLPGDEVPYKMVIKRVVGLPGDVIQISDGILFRNGVPIKEETFEPMDEAGLAARPITLKEGEYFCLGDNRNESGDSRKTGPVSIEHITHIVIW